MSNNVAGILHIINLYLRIDIVIHINNKKIGMGDYMKKIL